MVLIIYFLITTLLAFVLSFYNFYIPQLIALAAIILILISIKTKVVNIYLLSFIINLIIFGTGGLNSPVFFLIFFLLFTIAFQNRPSVTLTCSLISIVFLASSLDLNSILALLSLLLITPLAWFVGHQFLEKQKSDVCLSRDETIFLFWLKLKFKTGISKIIDSASILLSQPQLTPSQKEEVKFIRDSAKNLLNSSKKIADEIEHNADEI